MSRLGTPEVDRYLTEVMARLPGPPAGHRAIVAELRSGLLDASDAHAIAGLPPTAAVQAAIEEFGEPALVADGFKAEIAARVARRVAAAVLVSGPVVGALWIITAAASHLAHLAPGIRAGLGLIAVAAVLTALCALFGLAVTSRLTRWVPIRPGCAPAAAAAAGLSAVGADLLGVVLLAAELTMTQGKLSPVAAPAAIASVIRLMLARRAAGQCLAIRSALS